MNVPLRDALSYIKNALETMRKLPGPLRPYVIIEEVKPSGHFVQFCGDLDHRITFDIPLKEQVLKHGFTFDSRMTLSAFGIQIPDIEIDEGADLAVRVLHEGFGLDLDDEVSIIEAHKGSDAPIDQ